MNAVIGGLILAGLWWVWLDHRRKREAARAERRAQMLMAEHLPAIRSLAQEATDALEAHDLARARRAREALATLQGLHHERRN